MTSTTTSLWLIIPSHELRWHGTTTKQYITDYFLNSSIISNIHLLPFLQELLSNMSNPPLNQLDSQQTTTASSQPPTLEMQPYVATINEDNMVSQIDAIIRRFLTRPNPQSPYWFTLDWNAPEGTNLDYTIRLIIHEPSV
ncbi:unnamed protein product [Rotaria magnacalcarata]|uniref:Uncharacterized protein n=1 Tax=Rotaria magnacalcarata TaxID=392030 RepID=A0A816RMP0_9BILA|nr:unnamed protein product [Rotaria magnacalcarata]